MRIFMVTSYWKNLFARAVLQGERRARTERERNDFNVSVDYLTEEFCNLADRTKTSIQQALSSMLDLFARGVLHELFCTTTTVTPEHSMDGKVVVLGLPTHEFGQVGRIAQVAFKYFWQRAFMRRDVRQKPRPVCVFADECQEFAVTADAEAMAVSRSARVSHVYACQNLPGLIGAVGGGDEGKAKVQSMLGNFQTKVWHANGCDETNEWAAKTIGREIKRLGGGRSGGGRYDPLDPWGQESGSGGPSWSYHEHIDHCVEPGFFASGLRKGGPDNGCLVDAVLFQAGRRFRANGGRHFTFVTFDQRSDA
jgi:hypothetical protein